MITPISKMKSSSLGLLKRKIRLVKILQIKKLFLILHSNLMVVIKITGWKLMMNTNFILNKLKKIPLINNSKPAHLLISTVSIKRIRSLMNFKINLISMKTLIIHKSIRVKMIRIMKLFQIRPSEKIKVRPSKKNKPKNINIKNQFQISKKISMKISIVSSIDFFLIVWFLKK